MKTLLAILALSLAADAHACMAFLNGEYISGMNKICLYRHLSDTVAYNVPSYALCPLNIQVPH